MCVRPASGLPRWKRSGSSIQAPHPLPYNKFACGRNPSDPAVVDGLMALPGAKENLK